MSRPSFWPAGIEPMREFFGQYFSRAVFVALAVVSTLALSAKVSLAWRTFGTNDVLTFQQDAAKLEKSGWQALYRDGVQSFAADGRPFKEIQVFSHPPAMLHGLRLLKALARISGLPLGFWMRFLCALADLGSLLVILLLAISNRQLVIKPAAVLLLAASPISLFVSGFHGNTDSIMMFFVVLAVFFADGLLSTCEKWAPYLAGACIGLALDIKLVPAIFVPAVFFYFKSWKNRALFSGALMFVALVSSMPFVWQNPTLIASKLFGYSGQARVWGWSVMLVAIEDSSWSWIARLYSDYGKFAVLAMVGLLGWAMNATPRRLPLFAQCGLIAFFFLFFAPGFGVQYLSWLVPWTVFAGTLATAIYSLTGGAFLYLVYAHWSGSYIWDYANSFERAGWSRLGFFCGLLCWVCVGIILLWFGDIWLKRAVGPARDRPARPESLVA